VRVRCARSACGNSSHQRIEQPRAGASHAQF
jgi:hypothetical protein